MEVLRGNDNLSFGEAIRREDERLQEALPLQHRIYSYIDRGFYCEQLRRLWFYFTKEQVLVLKHEELKQQPLETLNCITSFLGIDRIIDIIPKDVHTLPYMEQMQQADKKFLSAIFYDEIRNIEQLLKWDCGDWLKT